MSLGDLPRGLRRLPRFVGGAVQADDEAAGEGATAPEFLNHTITARTTSQEALPANPRRRYLLLQNRGATDVFVAFGSNAEVATGLEISADNGNYEPYVAPSSSVNVISSSGSPKVIIIEGIGKSSRSMHTKPP